MEEKDQQWAIFWCSLLRPILYDEIEAHARHRHLRELSEETIRFPNGTYKQPSLSTLKRKLKQYQESGFEALARKGRSDRGKPRKVSETVIEKAVEIKTDQGKRSAPTINLFLKRDHGVTVPRSTLYRHLKQHGATRLKLGIVKEKVRCRWTREVPNDMWVGDFSDGPYILHEDSRALQTHLSLFIDCHSRFVVEGRYYLRESLDILIDSLLRAWTVHGLPRELYLDNAKIYHANALKAAAFSLRFKLVHRTVGDPSPGGLVERLFGTNQDQFETEVRVGDMLSLDDLNRAFQAWLHLYHHTVHSETKHTPEDLFQKATKRPIDMEHAMKFFMEKVTRTVHRDFSDVSVKSRLYAVDPKLRGDKVLVHYDPFGTMDKVFIYSAREEFLDIGKFYQRELQHRHPASTAQKKPKYNYLKLIVDQHEHSLQAQAHGIDFVKLIEHQRWPFGAMLQSLAELLGHSNPSAFSTAELEALKKLYDRYPRLNQPLLRRAFQLAEVKNITHIALQLQNLTKLTP